MSEPTTIIVRNVDLSIKVRLSKKVEGCPEVVKELAEAFGQGLTVEKFLQVVSGEIVEVDIAPAGGRALSVDVEKESKRNPLAEYTISAGPLKGKSLSECDPAQIGYFVDMAPGGFSEEDLKAMRSFIHAKRNIAPSVSSSYEDDDIPF